MDKDQLTVCRCEEISREEILQAIRDGHYTIDSIKKATRAGMGACQGRTCSKIIQGILLEGGRTHAGEYCCRKGAIPHRSLLGRLFFGGGCIMQYQAIVIGGGYFGCSISLHLARAGVRTLLLDKGEIGSGASGANFGNVQVQDCNMGLSYEADAARV